MHIKDTKLYIAIRRSYYVLKNWEKTQDDWKLYRGIRPLKDIHKGRACVVIGNGLSMRVEEHTNAI